MLDLEYKQNMLDGFRVTEMIDAAPAYEIGEDFSNVDAVGAIVFDPEHKRILLVRRLEKETDETGVQIPKDKRNKVDSNGNIILALPSGSGPLKDDPTNPDLAILKEIRSETGSFPALIRRFHTYKSNHAPNAKKVGFYIAEMSPDSLSLTNPHKDWPGWFPVEWFGDKIILPYAEHNQVVLDYLKEQSEFD